MRAASTAAQAVRLDRVTSDPTQTNQTVQFIGSFAVPRTGTLNLFSYVQLTDVQGRPIAIPGGGVTTLRLTAPDANGDLALNYLLLQPAAGNASGGSLVSVIPLPGSVGAVANVPVEATIYDGSNAVSQASVKLRVGGAEVGATVVRSGSVTIVKYTPSTLWAPGTTHNLTVAFNDGADRTFDWAFTTANYPVLTPAMKVTNATAPGFVWRVHQNEANQDTSIQKVLNALSGALGLPNLADPNSQGPASVPGTPANPGNGIMTFNIPTVINVSEVLGDSRGTFVPDDLMPGIPGTTLSDEGIAVEITTLVQLASGFHTMVVNCDDGFRTTAGFVNDATALTMGVREPGGGVADTSFSFAVQEAGVYAFRTLYFEGGGDASIEWFIIKSDGTSVLVNDTANGGPTSFQQGTIPVPPAGNVVLGGGLNGSGQWVLQWSSGTLLSSTNVSGPYLSVAGATSPHVVNPAESQRKFFRVQVQ